MVKSKAQMKIQQTAFMIIAVTLFFVLAGIFVLGFQLSSLKKDASLLQENNALLLVSKLANSPEFSCGEAFGTTRTNCVDFDKLISLKNTNKYRDFFGGAIELRKIYPLSETECSLFNYPNCGVVKIGVDNGTYVGNFVSLCRKEIVNGRTIDKCELAELMVSYGGTNG